MRLRRGTIWRHDGLFATRALVLPVAARSSGRGVRRAAQRSFYAGPPQTTS